MYVFWFIPVLIAGIALIWSVAALMKRRPERPLEEHVLVDKPHQNRLPKWYREKPRQGP